MTDYLERWCNDLRSSKSLHLKNAVEAWGECNIPTGSRPMYARVRLSLKPSDAFSVKYGLTPDQLDDLQQQGWDDTIVFGFLDVAMVKWILPLWKVELSILEVDVDPVKTVTIAMWDAARKAAEKMLSSAKVE